MVQLTQHRPLAPQFPQSPAWRRRYLISKHMYMARSEVKKRTLNIFSNLWWKYIPGTIVEVRWPVGWVVLHDDGNGGQVSTESADPNDHYRPWLEKNVGKQGWDWDWRIGGIAADNGFGTTGHDTLLIKFRRNKEDHATVAKLKWM